MQVEFGDTAPVRPKHADGSVQFTEGGPDVGGGGRICTWRRNDVGDLLVWDEVSGSSGSAGTQRVSLPTDGL